VVPFRKGLTVSAPELALVMGPLVRKGLLVQV